MKKVVKVITIAVAMSLSLNTILWQPAVAKASTVSEDTYSESTVPNDRYEQELQEGMDAYHKELLDENKSLKSFSTNAAPASVVSELVKLVLKNLVNKETKKAAAAVVVKATSKQISTRLTAHAIAEAVADGITSLMIDNVLSGKASGMFAIEKYTDPIGKSRIMFDRTNKVIIVLDATANTIITIYKDGKLTGTSIDSRVKSGRWIKSDFKFKN